MFGNRYLMRSVLGLFLVIVLAGVFFLGCSQPTPTPTPTLKPTPTSTSTSTPTVKPTLTPTPQLDQVKLKFTDAWGTAHPDVQISIAWMKRITEESGGRITFETFHGGTLGGPAELIDLLTTGAVDVAIWSCPFTPTKAPLRQMGWTVPFDSPSSVLVCQAMRQLYNAFPQFAEEEKRLNIKTVLLHVSENYNMLSKKAYGSLQEMKGDKVAVVGAYFPRWVAGSGMTPVSLGATERYQAMTSGVVVADVLTPGIWKSIKLHELAKNMVEINLGSQFFMMEEAFNLSTWNKLSKPTQDFILDVSAREEKRAAQWKQDQTKADIKEMGLTVVPFSETEKAAWAANAPDTLAEWAAGVEKLGYPGYEMAKYYIDTLEKLGYKFPRQWGKKP